MTMTPAVQTDRRLCGSARTDAFSFDDTPAGHAHAGDHKRMTGADGSAGISAAQQGDKP